MAVVVGIISSHDVSIPRGPTRFQITCALVEISFQNTKQFSERKISFQIINTTDYKSEKLRFLLVMSSLLNVPLKFNICRHVLRQFTILIFILYGAL